MRTIALFVCVLLRPTVVATHPPEPPGPTPLRVDTDAYDATLQILLRRDPVERDCAHAHLLSPTSTADVCFDIQEGDRTVRVEVVSDMWADVHATVPHGSRDWGVFAFVYWYNEEGRTRDENGVAFPGNYVTFCGRTTLTPPPWGAFFTLGLGASPIPPPAGCLNVGDGRGNVTASFYG